MNKRLQEILDEKKAALKNQIEASEYYRQYIQDWLLWVFRLRDSGNKILMESIFCPPQLSSNLQNLLAKASGGDENLSRYINPPGRRDIFENLQQKFTSTLSLRYLPRLPNSIFCEEDPNRALKRILPEAFPNEKIYILFPAYAGVASSDLKTILQSAESFFEAPMDICLTNEELSLVIYRSLEDEWLWQLPDYPLK